MQTEKGKSAVSIGLSISCTMRATKSRFACLFRWGHRLWPIVPIKEVTGGAAAVLYKRLSSVEFETALPSSNFGVNIGEEPLAVDPMPGISYCT